MQPIDTPVIFRAHQVRCRRSGRELFRGLNLEVHEGKHLGVVGANGSGKSTLLRLAAGLLHPRSGTIEVNGRSPRQRSVRATIGWLPDRTVFPPISVGTTLDLARRTTGSSPSDSTRVIDELELQPLLSRRATTLSQGQSRRLALALALLHQPRLLLLDEPFTALDVPSTDLAIAAIRRAISTGTTVVAAAPAQSELADLPLSCRRLQDGVVEEE